MPLADPTRLQATANGDPEFRMAARYWNAMLGLLPVLDEIRARG